MDDYVHFVYELTRNYPKEELYGVTSQFRRATLSVVLNYIEGYARKRPNVQLNFMEISYGSLQESKYLLDFSFIEKYIDKIEHEAGMAMAEEIGAMLWTELRNLEKNNDK